VIDGLVDDQTWKIHLRRASSNGNPINAARWDSDTTPNDKADRAAANQASA